MVLCVLSSMAADVSRAAEPVFDIDIPAMNAAEALNRLAEQTGSVMLFSYDLARAREANAVRGRYTLLEGLELLLRDTGLSGGFSDKRVVIIAANGNVPGGKGESVKKRGLLTALIAALFGSTAGESNADQAEERARQETPIEEIIVTAQKREETLQDVPISISVLDGARLDRSTFEGVREALNTVPGVSIATNQNSSPQVTVRGVSAASARFTGTGVAAFYLDTVPVGLVKSAIVPDTTAYDLQRIEVLRGPQGTLYGASALNGVIRVLTNDADLDGFEFKARGLTSNTEDGRWNHGADMALNVPIVDGRLAGRLVAGYQDTSGWIDRPIRENANDLQSSNLRLKVNAQPIDALSIGVSAWVSRMESGSQSIGDEDGRNPALLVEPSEDDFDSYGVRIGYEFPAFSVTSMTSYLDANIRSLTDFAPFGSAVVAGTHIQAEVLAEELIFSSNSEGLWRWSLGGIYRDAEDLTQQAFTSSPALVSDFTDTSESMAVFGEVTRVLLDGKLELTGGVRYFEDEVRMDDGLSTREGTNTFDAVTPRAVLSWLPSEDLTFYASYAEGFRSGANQSPAAFLFPPTEPDSLENYELGAKGNVLNGKVGFDAALYYIEWKDFQASRRISGSFGGVTVTTAALVNGESASGPGVDFGLSVRPTNKWLLSASATWNDLTLDEDALSGATLLARKGDRLNHSPEFSWAGFAEYAFPVGRSGLDGQITASVSHVSKQKSALNARVSSDAITIGRAGFSLRSPNHWMGTLFVDNVGNEQDISAALDLATAPYYNVRPRPRTIGVHFEVFF